MPRRLSGSFCKMDGWLGGVVVDLCCYHYYLPVREPSSRIRQVICPRWITSPALAGTKLRGRLGILMKPSKPMPADVMVWEVMAVAVMVTVMVVVVVV